MRWEIETFFAWWKRHLKVYHLISRNPHGVLLQLLAGLATYLLLVLYVGLYRDFLGLRGFVWVKSSSESMHYPEIVVDLHVL